MSLPGERTDTEAEVADALDQKSNAFEEVKVKELKTQWKRKISVIPPSEGVTTRWWSYTNGVSREGPKAVVPAGEQIKTDQSGEYNVGDPALYGSGVAFGGTDPGDGDKWWTGYTNRLDPNTPDSDGCGIGVKYFSQGEGDLGGATEAGPQEYVWFDSSVTGVSDLVIPKEQWDNPNVPTKLFRDGGFMRVNYYFYDEGFARINWGVKHDEGFDIRTLHTFTVQENPMWVQSDLKGQMKTVGAGIEGYIIAAHFKAGVANKTIRQNAEGRDGGVLGNGVNVVQGEPIPLVSINLRDGWENVNITPLGLSVDMDGSYYVFISVDAELTNSNFRQPGDDIPEFSQDTSEYAVLADNQADGFGASGVGTVEYQRYVSNGGRTTTSNVSEKLEGFGLADGEIATLGVVPVDATALNGSSLRWGTNF